MVKSEHGRNPGQSHKKRSNGPKKASRGRKEMENPIKVIKDPFVSKHLCSYLKRHCCRTGEYRQKGKLKKQKIY